MFKRDMWNKKRKNSIMKKKKPINYERNLDNFMKNNRKEKKLHNKNKSVSNPCIKMLFKEFIKYKKRINSLP